MLAIKKTLLFYDTEFMILILVLFDIERRAY